MERNRYNILLIMSDQQRCDSLGCYGNSQIKTPHIDALASEGMRFDHAFTPSSVCTPARASVLTGVYPHTHGAISNNHQIRQDLPTIADLLLEQGYRCGYAGKWHIDEERGPTAYGFEGHDFIGYAYPPSGIWENCNFSLAVKNPVNYYYEYLAENGIPVPRLEERAFVQNPGNSTRELYGKQTGEGKAATEEASVPYYVAEESIRLIQQFSRRRQHDQKPFFIWTNFWGPHNPCFIPEPWFSMYDSDQIDVKCCDENNLAGKPAVQQQLARYWGVNSDQKSWQQNIAKYWGYSSLIDAQVGRIRQALKASGEADNTIIIYTSDHGDMCGHHNLIDKGPYMYDDTYRIPFILYHPDHEGPVNSSDAFIYLHDIGATLAEIAGTENPFGNDGESILPLLDKTNARTNDRSEVFCEFEAQLVNYPQRMIRTRSHKLIYNQSDIGELYDLDRDPQETKNRINDPDYREIRDALFQTLLDHMEQNGDPMRNWFRQIQPVYCTATSSTRKATTI